MKRITKCMDRKIAASDLNYAVLKLAFSRGRGHTTSFVKRVWKWTKSNKVIKDQYIRLLNILDILLKVIVKAHYIRSDS